METIIITGSSGFIGYSLSKYLLNRGYRVIGIDVHNGEGEQKRLQDARLDQLIQFKNFTNIVKICLRTYRIYRNTLMKVIM